MRDEAILPGVRTLLNFSYSAHLCDKIRDAGVDKALSNLMNSQDLRVSDAATGCLARVGALNEGKHKTSWKGKSIADLMSLISTAGEEGASEVGGEQSRFNVFLSHRRTDSKVRLDCLSSILNGR